ncbi:sigma-70 family RNA polymerase sigma factor [Actinoplanes sp. TBRC 11911]|uniref:sigma-70 family RNA polymerase sigma factor n=1 Tax=Actinoplanes sp. TBRC 11911 TaxID=2729386 RepID=UPI00145CF7B0|nr:sigma-70 family RNA polymerase sigma factor [Actinoplanes sp. TBRC 11911]NMO50532.1 sigma-70 family RNA polymerase sigma factor [Actinoplanes sp. TBRC 11911]
MAVDDATEQWLADLRATGATRDAAHARLHDLLLRAARTETNRRANRLRLTGVEVDDLAHQAAADAMLAVLAKLSQFRGESRFTTWAYRFVVFEVSTKLGRHFWTRNPAVPLDGIAWERVPAVFGFSAEREAEWRELFVVFRHAVENELTDHQRQIFQAIVVDGVPLDALRVRLGTNRNAIYKVLFDARRKLRAVLVAKGHLPEER